MQKKKKIKIERALNRSSLISSSLDATVWDTTINSLIYTYVFLHHICTYIYVYILKGHPRGRERAPADQKENEIANNISGCQGIRASRRLRGESTVNLPASPSSEYTRAFLFLFSTYSFTQYTSPFYVSPKTTIRFTERT